jgi:hypothetical protein
MSSKGKECRSILHEWFKYHLRDGLADTSIIPKFLEALEFLNLPSTIEATYEEAVIITYLIGTVSPHLYSLTSLCGHV